MIYIQLPFRASPTHLLLLLRQLLRAVKRHRPSRATMMARWAWIVGAVALLSCCNYKIIETSLLKGTNSKLVETKDDCLITNSEDDTSSVSNITSSLIFVHFHKSGGTSVCSTMQKQNDIPMTDILGNPGRNPWLNCNTEFSNPDNKIRWVSTMQTCQMLEPYTTNDRGVPFTRSNFLAVEIPFREAMPCPGFRSFAIMRDPVKRLLSHMKVHQFDEETIRMWIQKRQRHQHDYYLYGYPIINSMIIRQLLGRARFSDVRPITGTDLELAKKQVDKFDAFVPLEFLNSAQVLSTLKDNVPEYYSGLTALKIKTNQQKHLPVYNSTFLAELARENVYDFKLYHYVLQKFGIEPPTPITRA